MTQSPLDRKIIEIPLFSLIIARRGQEHRILRKISKCRKYQAKNVKFLINNAFKRYYNIENLSQNQTIEILSDVNSPDNLPPPTTT